MNVKIYKLRLRKGKCTHINDNPLNKAALKRIRTKYIVYVIRCNRVIIYVGQVGRGIYRCAEGLTAKKSQGIAYPWRTHTGVRGTELEIMVISGFLPFHLLRKQSNREVIEADVAMMLFKEYRRWPEKLTLIKVHGKITRTQEYIEGVNAVMSNLKKHKWI